MERTITYRLHIWFSDLLDTDYAILAFGEDMAQVLEVEDGYVLRID